MTIRMKSARHLGLGIASFLLAASSGAAQTSLTVGSVPGFPGATVPVPVNVRQRGASAVAAQFDVTFNPGKVSALTALRGARLTNHVLRSRQIAPGVERILIYSLETAPLGGTNTSITSLPFIVSPTEFVGSGPLTPDNVVLATADGAQVPGVGLGVGAIFVQPVNLLPNGHVQFFLHSTQDQRYAIQATTNLVNWVNIGTNTAPGDFMNLLDVNAAGLPYRFYRWELLSP